ncbi:hypothetical protein SELMODRAFT_427057 [Selaginella moellendorffii]|uniref:Uncharacterized protein n=1 Tax=Selaginella moellendorffii TaxID=88036 RepID=D8SYD3_SELML|nr:hypothetical protein SELMODRAFT_427057 [Selaginella moellendorffii]
MASYNCNAQALVSRDEEVKYISKELVCGLRWEFLLDWSYWDTRSYLIGGQLPSVLGEMTSSRDTLALTSWHAQRYDRSVGRSEGAHSWALPKRVNCGISMEHWRTWIIGGSMLKGMCCERTLLAEQIYEHKLEQASNAASK